MPAGTQIGDVLVNAGISRRTFLKYCALITSRFALPGTSVAALAATDKFRGQPLLKGVSSDPVTVPRFGESIIELGGVSTLFGFVRQLQALQDKTSPGMHYKITGKLGMAKRFGSLPFSYEGTLLPTNTGETGL